jgi:predicted cobalt transporter CbtA
VVREFVMFIVINGIGIGISTGLTAIAKYGMNIQDKNVLFAAGVVGILVATVVRFFAYRFLVFNKELDEEEAFSHDHEIIEAHHRAKAKAMHAAGSEAGSDEGEDAVKRR